MDKPKLESFTIDSFESYESFLKILETRTIDKDFKVRFRQFKNEEDYFRLLGIDLDRIKAIIKNSGASSVQTTTESVDSTCSEIDSTSADTIKNGFEHLTSFSLSVDELKITLKPLLTEPVSKEVFVQLVRLFYNLMSDGLKEFYFNERLQGFLSEPHSKSAPISDELFLELFDRHKNKESYLASMATNLVIEKISQDFLMTLPVTLEKIDLSYSVEEVFLNMSSTLKHLTIIESIDLWVEYFANPKLLILPQLKSFLDCQNLKIPFNLYEDMLEYLNEESNGAAAKLDLSKEKIQELSSKVGFQNLKRLEIIPLKKDYIEGTKLIQLKLIPSLEVVEFVGWIRLCDAEELTEFIDDTSLEKIIFYENFDNEYDYVEIIRNCDTNKFDKRDFDIFLK